MTSVKIKADYIGDEGSYIVFVASVDESQVFDTAHESFGFGYVENRETTGIERYPFILEEHDENLALMDWGTYEARNIATVDILNRSLKVGELITYNEIDEDKQRVGPYVYRIVSIEAF